MIIIPSLTHSHSHPQIKKLIQGNISNQNYFREMSCVPRLAPLFTLSGSDLWLLTEKKQEILFHGLQTVSILVTGTNPSLIKNQEAMKQGGVLDRVLQLALNKLNCPPVRTQALRTLGDLVRNCASNRNVLGSATIEVDDHARGEKVREPALQRLLTVTLNSHHFSERIAAVHTFKVLTRSRTPSPASNWSHLAACICDSAS